jgi:hypothetical protein
MHTIPQKKMIAAYTASLRVSGILSQTNPNRFLQKTRWHFKMTTVDNRTANGATVQRAAILTMGLAVIEANPNPTAVAIKDITTWHSTTELCSEPVSSRGMRVSA